ncbi:MAG: CPBP family intramembrane metalloprotease [Corallococcus sp.]|nr:CPBP family intramembrane metalloprotease [Corallococcus sp.]
MLKNKFNKNDIGALFASAVFATFTVALIASFVSQIFSVPQDNNVLRIVQTAVNTIAIGSVAFIYAKASRTNVVTASKMNAKPPLAHIGWGCLATVCLIAFMLPLNMWISKLIVSLGLPDPSVDIDFDIASLIILAAVLPAFFEEIVFRGAIAGALEGNKNKLASLAIAGALFSLFHMNPAQTVHQFALGALLALIFYRSGSLWTTVIIHFFNNIFVIALSAIFGDEAIDSFINNNAIWLFFVGLVCFAGCIVGYMFTTKSKWQSNNDEEPKYNRNCLILLIAAVAVCAAVWLTALIVSTE